jgi:hypothetical protein
LLEELEAEPDEVEECYRCELPKVCEDNDGRPVCSKHAAMALKAEEANHEDTPSIDLRSYTE